LTSLFFGFHLPGNFLQGVYEMQDLKFSFMSVAFLALIIAGLIGWVMNVLAIAQADSLTGFVILRIAGAFFPPLGAILGYI